MGTDLNRNWGYHWADGGSSFDPCSQIYHGTRPFSEVENRNVRDFVWAHKVIEQNILKNGPPNMANMLGNVIC